MSAAQWHLARRPLVVSHCLTHCCRLNHRGQPAIIIIIIVTILPFLIVIIIVMIIMVIIFTKLMQCSVSALLSAPTAKSVTPFFSDKEINSSHFSSSERENCFKSKRVPYFAEKGEQDFSRVKKSFPTTAAPWTFDITQLSPHTRKFPISTTIFFLDPTKFTFLLRKSWQGIFSSFLDWMR